MAYRLSFDFWAHSKLWSLPDLTIMQLVEDPSNGSAQPTVDDRPMNKLSNWWQKKKKMPNNNATVNPEAEHNAALFVFEEAKRLIEDPSFKKKALKGLIFFREALLSIEALLQNVPQVCQIQSCSYNFR